MGDPRFEHLDPGQRHPVAQLVGPLGANPKSPATSAANASDATLVTIALASRSYWASRYLSQARVAIGWAMATSSIGKPVSRKARRSMTPPRYQSDITTIARRVNTRQ